MKRVVKVALAAYFAGGAICGLLMFGSYLWGATFGGPTGIGLIGSLMLLVTSSLLGLVFAVVRNFLWLPSLISWYLYSVEPFLWWLMPGLYIQGGAQ